PSAPASSLPSSSNRRDFGKWRLPGRHSLLKRLEGFAPNHYRSGACRGIAQLVERRSPKPQVAGSVPAPPAMSSNRAGKSLEHGSRLAISCPLMHIDAIAGTERLVGSDAAFDNKAD